MLFTAALAAAPIEAVDPEPDKPADFYVDVYPVLEAKCLACHSRTTHEADLILEDVASITKGGASGPAVTPGKPDGSLLFRVCARLDESAMPPLPNKVGAVPLTPQELGRLRRWIQEGAQPGKANPSAAAIGWQALPSTMIASYALALGPQQRFVAIGRANTVTIYDLVTGQEAAHLADPLLQTIKTASLLPLYDRDVAHFDVVQALAISPDGDSIASGGYREIKMWQRQRNVIAVRSETEQPAVVIALNDATSNVIVGTENGSVAVFDLDSGEKAKSFGPVIGLSAVAVASDGTKALVGTASGDLALWNLEGAKPEFTWPAGAPVTAVAYAHDGKSCLSGHADGSIRRWLVPQETPTVPIAATHTVAGNGSSVRQLAISRDNLRVHATFADGRCTNSSAELADMKDAGRFASPVRAGVVGPEGAIVIGIEESGRSASVLRTGTPTPLILPSMPQLARQISVLESDKTVAESQRALAAAAVKLADKESTERAEFQTKAEQAKPVADEALVKAQAKVDELEAVVKVAKEKLVALPDDEALKKAVADAEAALMKPREAATAAKDAQIAADRTIRFAQQAAQAARGELVRLKSAQTAREQRIAEIEKSLAQGREGVEKSTVQIHSAAISPDARFVATGHSDGFIHLWAADDGRWLETLEGHTAAVRTLQFTKEQSLVSTGDDRALLVWNLRPQWKLAGVLGVKPESRLDVSESPMIDRVLALAFSPDGRKLASGGGEPSRSGEVLLWDVGSLTVGRELRELHSDTVSTLAFSRDGSRLATAAADKFAKVTDVESGRLLKGYEGHTGHVLGVAWKADSSSLATGGADGAIKVWNVETGEQRKSIAATTGQVTSVCYLGLSDTVAGANSKGQAQLFEAESGKSLRTCEGAAGYLYNVRAFSDGRWIAASGEDGVLRVWNAADGKLVQEFKPPAVSASPK